MEWTIDPANPGEVLACAGIAHLVWLEDLAANTGFKYVDHWTFCVPDGIDYFHRLRNASLIETPDGLRFADMNIDWWQDWGLNKELKNWAGQQTALTVHRSLLQAAGGSDPTEWLEYAAPTTGRLNLDSLGTWNALGMGWSLNEHRHTQMLCRPWVEILASFGLQAFPLEGSRSEGAFRYHLWEPGPLPATVAAFTGHGAGLYALAKFRTPTAKAGSNTMLCRATAVPLW